MNSNNNLVAEQIFKALGIKEYSIDIYEIMCDRKASKNESFWKECIVNSRVMK
jgi:hypothetical protein